MRETIEWGEETLLAWNNDLAKSDMDVNILEEYHLEDNNRFKVIYKLQETDCCRHNNGGIYDLGIRFTKTAPSAGRHRKRVYRRKRS